MHLTEEEKNLKKKYQKLREKRVQLKRLSEKQQSSSSPLQAKREILNPKDAKEAAKKLLSQGKLSIKKVEVKRTGFKRVGQQGNAPETPPPKKRDTKGSESRRSKGEKESKKQNEEPPKPKPKPKPVILPDNYKKTFVKSTEQQSHIPKSRDKPQVPSQPEQPQEDSRMDRTICVIAQSMVTEDILSRGLKRFNGNRDLVVTLDESKKKGFVSFYSKSSADKAQQEMNDGRVSAIDIKVSKAGPENGYVELPSELESVPWVKQAASKDSHSSAGHKRSRPAVKYYDLDDTSKEEFY